MKETHPFCLPAHLPGCGLLQSPSPEALSSSRPGAGALGAVAVNAVWDRLLCVQPTVFSEGGGHTLQQLRFVSRTGANKGRVYISNLLIVDIKIINKILQKQNTYLVP